MLIWSSLVVAALIVMQWGLKHPYANDSAGYIQEAVNLLEGRGLTRAASWDATNASYAAFPLFPPGFSLAAAGLGVLGVPAPWAALAISWLAWLGIAPAAAWAIRPLTGLWPARAIGLLAAASPAFAEWGFQALSDAPMVLFSVLSLGVLARADALPALSLRAWVFSGLLAGIAYLFRNAGAVLPLTVIALLALALVMRRLAFVATLRSGLAWGTGFALLAFPLFAYNFFTFGSIQPYFAAHGTVDYGLLHAARISLWSLLLDMTGWRFMADLAWNGKLLVALAPFALAAAWLVARRRDPPFPLAGTLLLLYSLIGCTLVVWGRSRFDWVETTLTRQMMPYAWALLALAVWALRRLSGRAWLGAAWIALIFLAGGRGLHLSQDIARERAILDASRTLGYAETARQHPDWVLTQRIKLDAVADTRLVERIRALPPDAHVVSNQAGLLSVPTHRAIRAVTLAPADLAALRALRPRLGKRERVLIVVATNARLHEAGAAHWQDDFLADFGHDASVLHASPLVLMVRMP
ncbi:MAG: hypothetical protein AB1593_00710 [Pseudomonadota bacterium]